MHGKIQKDFPESVYDLGILLQKYKLLTKEGMNKDAALDALILSSEELVSKEAPKYEYIAGRLLAYKINKESINREFAKNNKLSNLSIDAF